MSSLNHPAVKNMIIYRQNELQDVFPTSFSEWPTSKTGAVFGIIRRHTPDISVLINEALNARAGEEVHVVGGIAFCWPNKTWVKALSDPILSTLENSVVAVDSNDLVPKVTSAPYSTCSKGVLEVNDKEGSSTMKTTTRSCFRNRNRIIQVSDDFFCLPISEITELISPFMDTVFPEKGSSKWKA